MTLSFLTPPGATGSTRAIYGNANQKATPQQKALPLAQDFASIRPAPGGTSRLAPLFPAIG